MEVVERNGQCYVRVCLYISLSQCVLTKRTDTPLIDRINTDCRITNRVKWHKNAKQQSSKWFGFYLAVNVGKILIRHLNAEPIKHTMPTKYRRN